MAFDYNSPEEGQAMIRILQLSDQFVPVDKAFEIVKKELLSYGLSPENADEILSKVEDELNSK